MTSPAVHKLVEDARSAGFTIRLDGQWIDIYKGRNVKHHNRPNLGVTITVTETGAFSHALRNDIDPSYATVVRSLKKVRELLRL